MMYTSETLYPVQTKGIHIETTKYLPGRVSSLVIQVTEFELSFQYRKKTMI